MRVLLFTGKGGVGKTTAAAGTAALGALSGRRALVLSTDPAHSLGDVFGQPIDGVPTRVDDDLFVQHVDSQRRFEACWVDIQHYLMSVLDAAGVDPVAAEELAVLPGAEEVMALLEVRDQVMSGKWDLIVVDCAPTAETLRLLALPEALSWYMDRVFPVERRVVKALRPILARAAGVPMPHDGVFDAIESLHADLSEVRTILCGANSSVRLVLTPESVVVAEARRSLTTLSLYGYRVDGVLANRIFPASGADGWRSHWVASQTLIMTEVEESFAPLPIWRAGYQPCEPVGAGPLSRFAEEVYANIDAFASPNGDPPLTMRRDGEGVTLRLSLPFVTSSDVDLARHDGEMVVTAGSYRRVLALPTALRNADVLGAGVVDGALKIRFGSTTSSPLGQGAR
jgi:arsenite/tail-anchored protein-transporting ATPase